MSKPKAMSVGLILLVAVTAGVWLSLGGGSVDAQAGCIAEPPGMAGWWPGDGNADDIRGGNHGTLQGGATFAPGMVGQAFSLDGSSEYVDLGSDSSLGLQYPMSTDAWINLNQLPSQANRHFSIVSRDEPGNNREFEFRIRRSDLLTFAVYPSGSSSGNESFEANSPFTTLDIGTWIHVAVTIDANRNVTFYRNGSADGSGSISNSAVPSTNASTTIGEGLYGNYNFDGIIDEVEFFDVAVPATDIQAIFDAGSAGKCKSGEPDPTPTPTATLSPTATPSPTSTPLPTPTSIPTATTVPTATAVPQPPTVDWVDVTNKPVGFADDTDNDAIGDLSCDPDQLARWNGSGWECFFDGPTVTGYRIANVNEGYTAITVGSDGLPLIGFFDQADNGAIKIAHCLDAKCTNAEFNTIDNIMLNSPDKNAISIAVGGDGFGVLVYGAANAQGDDVELRIAHCESLDCGSSSINVVDTFVGKANLTLRENRAGVAIGNDGFALIAYNAPLGVNTLKVAHCENTACSASTVTILDIDNIRDGAAIALGSDGLGIISYQVNYPQQSGNLPGLKVAHCENTDCSTAIYSTPGADPSIGHTGIYSSVTIGSDGFPIIGHVGQDLKVTHCKDVTCSSSTTTLVSRKGSNFRTSIALGADNLPIVLWGALNIAHCENVACDDFKISDDLEGEDSFSPSIAIGVDGIPIISHIRSRLHLDLAITHCTGSPTCSY